jgi:hypothetical protein
LVSTVGALVLVSVGTVTVMFAFTLLSVEGGTVEVSEGTAGEVVFKTETPPLIAGIASNNAVNIKHAAAAMVIRDKTDCVPRGPKAVLEMLLVKSAPASALPGCNKIVATKTMQEIKNKTYNKVTNIFLLIINYFCKALGIEACSADQRAVNILLFHQISDVICFN